MRSLISSVKNNLQTLVQVMRDLTILLVCQIERLKSVRSLFDGKVIPSRLQEQRVAFLYFVKLSFHLIGALDSYLNSCQSGVLLLLAFTHTLQELVIFCKFVVRNVLEHICLDFNPSTEPVDSLQNLGLDAIVIRLTLRPLYYLVSKALYIL